MNTYGYVGGNPLSYIDPLGLKGLSRLLFPRTTPFPMTTPDGDHITYSNPIQDLNDAMTVFGWNTLMGITKMCSDSGEDVEEEYDSLGAAVGEVNPLDDVEYEGKTKNPGLREQGFTEKWSGADSNGDIQTAFKNPKTGKWTGGHRSSKNNKYW